MAKRSISYGDAIAWFDKKKAERINDNRLTSAYNRSKVEMDTYTTGILNAEYEMEKYMNSIATLKDAIVAVRGKKKLGDKLVAEMNKKVTKHSEWSDSRNACVTGYHEAKRLVDNYDRDDEKELFFFWQMLHDILPDQTPTWFDFKREHRDFYYKHRYEQQAK